MNIRRLLIANRGEIAVRIIASCRKLGIHSIVASSEADLASLPAKLADEVVLLGPAPASASYLNISAVIQAARHARADAIHPGYGFLSENAAFAHACTRAGLIFVGPTEQQLQGTGDKLLARQFAEAAGLPLLPGAEVSTLEDALPLAEKLGWPVLIKAVGGGGGRGMKVVHAPAQLSEALTLAMMEAGAAFANPRVYLEPYVTAGRHVEVQILGDGKHLIHLGTRDCSVQRRYQKLIEEAPAPDLSDALRSALENSALDLGRHLGYRSAGTVEFLVDTVRNSYYFLELNARIQVEHPVSEAISGIDLVAQQIRIAEGRPLGLLQRDVYQRGHAIECRINAEDPDNNFAPSPGHVSAAAFPAASNIRMDTHIETGAVIPPYYDSLMGKLIVWGEDRQSALRTMEKALALCHIEGVSTNVKLLHEIITHPEFSKGAVTTGFLTALLAGRSSAGNSGVPHG